MSTGTHISTQIETLKQSIETREEDNQKLRSELKATQEKLQKSEERKEALISSIVKLQDIVHY
jgi:outer membrane murein-binding lipoprotein Lpp